MNIFLFEKFGTGTENGDWLRESEKGRVWRIRRDMRVLVGVVQLQKVREQHEQVNSHRHALFAFQRIATHQILWRTNRASKRESKLRLKSTNYLFTPGEGPGGLSDDVSLICVKWDKMWRLFRLQIRGQVSHWRSDGIHIVRLRPHSVHFGFGEYFFRADRQVTKSATPI